MNKLEFTPKTIGLPDQKKADQITKIYSEICTNASALLWNLEFYLECMDKMELPEFFDFLNEKDPTAWLYLRYIEYHGLSFPGIAIAKIIEFQMVDVPVESFKNLLEERAKLLSQIQSSKDFNFYYPLAKLFDFTESNRGFAITNQGWGLVATEFDKTEYQHVTTEFDEMLYKHVRTFTESEAENEAIQTIENAVDGLNELIKLGVIRNEKQKWENDLYNFIRAIVFTMNEEKPLSINPRVDRLKGFQKLFEKRGWSQIQGKPEDILKFVEPAPEHEAMTEDEVTETEQAESEHEETFANE